MKTTIMGLMAIGMIAALPACTTTGGEMDDMAAATGSNPVVGGAEMLPTRNIVENAVNSRDHTTLVAAVQAAGLAETLSGPGPFTVFAPTNRAFEKLPAGTVDTLLRPENRALLQGGLTYHVVPGTIDAARIATDIRAGNGTASYTTVQGGQLRASMRGGRVVITDANGGTSTVTQADVRQSNGVIHVVDSVLLPAQG